MKKITYLLIFLSFYGCKKDENIITDDQVKAKFYQFFETLSVDNPDKTKLYDLVTDDYYIFENERRYTMDEFIEFVNSFDMIESEWDLRDFVIDTDSESAHATLTNIGRFVVKTDSGNIVMNFEWLESAYLIKQNDDLKFKFYFSDAVKESIELQ
tara:strand:+ start:2582 stop:3046 length:465 start_codon:yes stop_codon:yes gene_type:complete